MSTGANSGVPVAQFQRSAILAALVEAGTDGLPKEKVEELGGYWWSKRVAELAERHAIGWDEVDGEKRYFRTDGVEQADGAKPVEGTPVESAVGLLNTEAETLFDAPVRSHYETEREAA